MSVLKIKHLWHVIKKLIHLELYNIKATLIIIYNWNPQQPPSTFVVTQYSNMFPYQKNESNTLQYMLSTIQWDTWPLCLVGFRGNGVWLESLERLTLGRSCRRISGSPRELWQTNIQIQIQIKMKYKSKWGWHKNLRSLTQQEMFFFYRIWQNNL